MDDQMMRMLMEQLRMSGSGSSSSSCNTTSHSSSNLFQTSSAVIKASEVFDKAVLVDSHQRALLQAAEMQKQPFKIQPSLVEAAGASVPLAGLAPIRLQKLKVGVHHVGRVLYGTLCVDAFKVSGVLTVLEDDAGKAVRLLIYNAALSSSSSQAVRRLFPKGRSVAVKEPYLKRCVDGSIAVRVDNPGNIEAALISRGPGAAPPIHHADAVAAFGSLREQGNRCFASQDWLGAIDFYSKCIDLATKALQSSSSSSSGGGGDSASVEQDKLAKALAMAFSNRAETWLKLHKLERGLDDAKEALLLDSTHVKSQYRKARALCGLQRHKEACQCLEMALQQCPVQHHEIQAFLDKCRIHVLQSENGEYDYANSLLKASKMSSSSSSSSFSSYSDYVGPVKIGIADSIRGRGLFTTKNVEMGSLLLVSNAVAQTQADWKNVYLHMNFATSSLNFGNQEDLVTTLVDAARRSPKTLKQLNTLKASSSSSSSLEVPCMELFKPNSVSRFQISKEWHDAEVDIARIRETVKYNSFGTSRPVLHPRVKLSEELMQANGSSGLWMLPSFINHSCIPNASMNFVGNVMFVHAAHDLQEGEEVTFPYFDVLVPYKQREAFCSRWGFSCLCKRCEFEKFISKALTPLSNQFSALHEKALKAHSAHPEISDPLQLPECAKFHSLALKLENMFSTSLGSLEVREKQWIRATFAAAYLVGSKALELNGSDAATSLELRTLLDSMHATVPGHMMTLVTVAQLMSLAHSAHGKREGDWSLNLMQELLMKICISTFGKHAPHVLKELLESYSN